MKKFIVPLLTAVIVVSIVFAGCVPAVEPAPPVTPPVTPPGAPVIPPPVTPPPVAPEIPLSPAGMPIYLPELANLNPIGENFAVKPDGTPYMFATTYLWVTVDPMFNYVANMHSLIKRAGGYWVTYDPMGDAARQIAWVEDQIAVQKPDCILMQPCSEALLAPVVDKASDAGIPTIAWDFDIFADNTVSCVRDYFIGDYGSNLLGEYFIELAERTGEHIYVFEIWGDMAVESSQHRHQGFHAAVDAHPDLITVIESGDKGWWSVEAAADYVIDAFTAHPELNGTYQHGGGSAGSLEGLRAIGRLLPIGDPDHVYISTNDSDTLGAIEMDAGTVDAFANHGGWHLSDVAVKIAFTHVVLGQPVPRFVDLPLVVITPETIDTHYFFGALAAYPRMPKAHDLWPVLDYSVIGIETPTEAMKGTDYNPTANYRYPDQATYDECIVTPEEYRARYE